MTDTDRRLTFYIEPEPGQVVMTLLLASDAEGDMDKLSVPLDVGNARSLARGLLESADRAEAMGQDAG